MAKKQEGKCMSDEKQPQYGEWEDLDNQNNDTPQVIPSPSMENKVPLLSKFHELTPTELGLGAAGIAAVTMAGRQLINNAVSRIFPSESERQYREQNNIQKEKLNRGLGQTTESDIEHQQRLREIEYSIAQEKLNRERIRTQQLQAKEGIASTEKPSAVPANVAGSTVELPNTATPGIQTTPTATAESTLGMLPPVTHNAQGVPAPFAVPAQINPSSNPTGAIGVGNMPEGGSPAPFSTQPVIPSPPAPPTTPAPLATPTTTPAQQVIEQTTGTAPKPPVSNQSAIGEVSANPVESGSEANPLHEPGSDVGKTQLQASAESTENKPPKLEKEIKGAVKPVISRRTKKQTEVFEEEMPQNKFYNQIANRLAGTENLKEHPHITQQFDKAWEDVFHNVLGGKMERSQGGSPAKINEIESHINANAEKYPDLVRYMNEAKQYAKGNVNPKEGGFSHIGAMLGMLGAGGLGAYMLHRYGNPFEESMKKANEAMGDVTGTQDLLKANKAEELSPAMRALFIKASNPVYRKEINEQLVTEKNPERINQLKRELEKAK